MAELAPGALAYGRSGAKYEFVEALSEGRALVRQILTVDGWEGQEEYPAESALVVMLKDISASKPVQAIDEEVSAAAARLEEIQEQVRAAEHDLKQSERAILDRVAKLKTFDGLERIEDFLDGNITHFVVRKQYYNNVDVLTFDEFAKAKDDRGRTNGDVKLLCLFGTSASYHAAKRTAEWRLNNYYDGSGSWTTVQPATSEDEAIAIAKQWLENDFAAYVALPDADKRPWAMEGAVASAVSFGMSVPDEIVEGIAAAKEKNARANLAKAEEAVAAAMIALEQVTGGA